MSLKNQNRRAKNQVMNSCIQHIKTGISNSLKKLRIGCGKMKNHFLLNQKWFCIKRVLFYIKRVLFCIKRVLFYIKRVWFCIKRVLFYIKRVLFCIKRVLFCIKRVISDEKIVLFCSEIVTFHQKVIFWRIIPLQKFKPIEIEGYTHSRAPPKTA